MKQQTNPLLDTIKVYNRGMLKLLHWVILAALGCGVAALWGWGWGWAVFIGIIVLEVVVFG